MLNFISNVNLANVITANFNLKVVIERLIN